MALIKTKNEAGEEVEIEAFTPEEVNAKIAEEKSAIEKEYEAKIAEKDTTLSTLAKEKEDLELKLAGEKEDNPNFKILKDALAKKDQDIQKISSELAEDRALRTKEAMEQKINKASNGNKELADKIKYNLEKVLVGMKEGTAEEREAKFTAALKLSTDHNEAPGMFDQGTGGGNRGGDFKNNGAGGVEFTTREKALGSKMGLSEEDYKKYGPRLSK